MTDLEMAELRRAVSDVLSQAEYQRKYPACISIDTTRVELGGVAASTVYDLVNKGELVKVNVGRRGFILGTSLAAYIDRLAEAATA